MNCYIIIFYDDDDDDHLYFVPFHKECEWHETFRSARVLLLEFTTHDWLTPEFDYYVFTFFP